ncbi:hypothetical protein, partial [Escherichia coli]|uniref:hypothetical protein n=1 Tax=Escherichia coli TaxID=562 RepID=UPI001BAEF1A9
PGTDRNAEYGGSGAISCLIFRLAGLSLGLAQKENEEANEEQGRQTNPYDFMGFPVCEFLGLDFYCAVFFGMSPNPPPKKKTPPS